MGGREREWAGAVPLDNMQQAHEEKATGRSRWREFRGWPFKAGERREAGIPLGLGF